MQTRREFIKTGGKVVIGSLVIPQLLYSYQLSNSFNTMMHHFNVSEQDLKKIISVALSQGGDYADIFFEHSLYNSVVLRDGAVNVADANVDFGVGIRVVDGDRTGYAYTETTTVEEMLKAAKTAANIVQGANKYQSVDMTLQKNANYYPFQQSWEGVMIDKKIPIIENFNKRVFELDKRVQKVNISLRDSSTYVLFYNSLGILTADYRPMVALSVNCVMEENGRTESNQAGRSFRMGFEFLTPEIIEELSQEVIKRTGILFEAEQPKGGQMEVVMGCGGSGILLHEAIGHAFEADFNRKNISIFSDQLGKKICNEHITVLDDGTISHNRGSVNVDDEGVEGQKTYIVKEGVLNSYLHDRISAKHYGVNPTGNGRRESFRDMPIPRMRATYMENGNVSEQEIIATVKKGIYAETFSNGQVQIGAGDFTFFVKTGYLIENGKLTQPIKDVNIIGNGPKALSDITMVSNNYKMDNGTWTCGKDGQSCPVTCGMPSVLVKSLIVGGKS